MLAIWALMTLGILALIVAADMDAARRQLDRLGQTYLRHVSDRALVSETAIEGFAAFVGSMDPFDHDKAKAYASNLLQRYPFLYMFEVAKRVPHDEREKTEERLGRRYPGYRIKHFSYDSDRAWRPAEPADYYYPLIFQEPMLTGQENLIGLDIHASPHLKDAMRMSFQRGEPVATNPFDLAEGGRGYVLHRPVDGVNHRPSDSMDAPAYVMLALKSATLFSQLQGRPARIDVRILHRLERASNHLVLALPAVSASATEKLLLPSFHEQRILDLNSQPLLLRLEWQLGWADLSLRTMLICLLGSLLMFGAVRGYARQYIRSEFLALEKEGRLYELANFDSLTGLANRNHLIDFLESALARAHRHNHQLAVLFIDVNDFKAVNDTYGHAAGDFVLSEVGSRLAQELREDELLARYGGDEFVWVSADSLDVLHLDGLIQRIKRRFEPPVVFKKNALLITISIGSSVYPRDGRNVAALFDVADENMYRDKRNSSDIR